MANEWIYSDGRACYDTATPGFTLSQSGVMTPGQLAYLKITVSGMTQGSLTIYGIEEAPVITEDGEYEYISKATFTDLVIYPGVFGAGTFDGCVDDIEVNLVPTYTIKDLNDNVVFELTDTTGVTADRDYIQYQINWLSLEEGCYYIEFSDGPITYQSYCFTVKTSHSCSLQLEWTNDQDAFGFDYTGLSFTASLRVEGKIWKPRYPSEDKNIHEFSNGTGKITNVRVNKEYTLDIKEAPEYIHDAIAVGLNHDTFMVNDINMLFVEEEATPNWRNSSNLAPISITVRRNDQDLLNSNC